MNPQLPEQFEPFAKEAQKLLASGNVKDIEFSGETYQVLVADAQAKKEYWTFLQFDKRHQLKDFFCSCQEDEEEEITTSACTHVAAAYLRLFNGHAEPLHARFKLSLWNQLGMLYANRTGTDPNQLSHKSYSHYFLNSIGGKLIFDIMANSPQAIAALKTLLQERRRETEETSLKFSNLPPEEIILWKEGRPSFQLKYELSFWCDLAKWLMQLQDEKQPYEIIFNYAPNGLPNQIEIRFKDLAVFFYLSEANLPLIIPSLTTVNSPLKAFEDQLDEISQIIYDKEASCLKIETKKMNPEETHTPPPTHIAAHAKGIATGSWLFVPNEGFYAKHPHDLLKKSLIHKNQIEKALDSHLGALKRFIKDCTIQDTPTQMTYSLSFDAKWNLHMTSYLFEPGDLSTPRSKLYGKWVYLEDDGFYRVEGMQFNQIDMSIRPAEVSNFVNQHRSWLNTQEGFKTHLSNIESQLTYAVTANHRLSFFSRIDFKDSSSQGKDFGAWVYIANQGFYSKVSASLGILRPDLSVPAEQIPLFIRMNREELHLVPGFFSEQCPVLRSGLRVDINEDEQIQITPEYELSPHDAGKHLKFFDDFVYVDNEGFHELPVDSRLPERFRHPLVLEEENVAFFLDYELPTIKNYAVFIDPRLQTPMTLLLHANSIKKKESEGKKWYELKLHYSSERAPIPVAQVWAAINKKKHFLFSAGGLLKLQDERFNWLKLLGKGRIDRRSNTLTLSTLELIRLNAFEQLQHHDLESEELLNELTDFKTPHDPNLIELGSTLRPYQVKGVHWLWFLYHHQLSGLLCDDMGLGKTHQAMALLAAVHQHHIEEEHKTSYKYLIVCPTSVMYHWQDKLQKFLPSLRVTMFYGAKRSLVDFKENYDILLTSYGIWRNENAWLGDYGFDLAIFDEIQVAKNHNSLTHSALLNVKARMKVGLTGTPIENHLRELKSLFDIVLPTYMPSEKGYRETFVKPIEKEKDYRKRDLLTRFIKPFIMRRRKEDVLTDLPEKIEEIAYCDLLESQQVLYVEALNQARQHIVPQLQDQATPIPYIHIFALLTHLKQICDHPAVYLKEMPHYKKYPSGKWNLFVELLNEARASQQKVVVFSQYLGMLDIIQEHLNEHHIHYATIRGSTTNRWEEVSKFQEDPTCEVFVGSLTAAGLGIDLTSASVVIHYDRWWNAARENQATDRVHRIGQQRGVQVFKLVTKGTFEEKIDAMIAKKGKLMEDVVGVDDHQLIKQFDREELIHLLQYVERKDKPISEWVDNI